MTHHLSISLSSFLAINIQGIGHYRHGFKLQEVGHSACFLYEEVRNQALWPLLLFDLDNCNKFCGDSG